MQQDDIRRIVTSQFYQSLAESGVEITALPQNQLQAVVAALADGLYAALDALGAEDEAAPASAAVMEEGESSGSMQTTGHETPLWRGRPFLTIGTYYELTTQRLRVIRGILGRNIEELELVRVRDTKVSQHAGERAINVGDITVVSADPTTPQIELRNVRNPLEVRELIRKATVEEKNRRHMYYREDIGQEEGVHGA